MAHPSAWPGLDGANGTDAVNGRYPPNLDPGPGRGWPKSRAGAPLLAKAVSEQRPTCWESLVNSLNRVSQYGEKGTGLPVVPLLKRRRGLGSLTVTVSKFPGQSGLRLNNCTPYWGCGFGPGHHGFSVRERMAQSLGPNGPLPRPMLTDQKVIPSMPPPVPPRLWAAWLDASRAAGEKQAIASACVRRKRHRTRFSRRTPQFRPSYRRSAGRVGWG